MAPWRSYLNQFCVDLDDDAEIGPAGDQSLTMLESHLAHVLPPSICQTMANIRESLQTRNDDRSSNLNADSDTTMEDDADENDPRFAFEQQAFDAFMKGVRAPDTRKPSIYMWEKEPDNFIKPLHPHQLEACGRWAHAEASGDKAFNLADDTGLGKTVEALAVISNDPGDDPNIVVCPGSLISTWDETISKFIRRGTLKILIFKGEASQQKTLSELGEYNIILVSYQVLRNQHQKKKEWIARLQHQRFTCDRTLVPKHPGGTYPVDYFQRSPWPLTELKSKRAIFDEGHDFRNYKTATFECCRAVAANADTRVVMTATRIQNGFRDLWSILAVLRVEPFNNWGAFKSHFLNRPAKTKKIVLRNASLRQKAEVTDPTGGRRKILSVIFEGISIHRGSFDYFDGQRIVPELNLLEERRIEVPLSTATIEDRWYEDLGMEGGGEETEYDFQVHTKGWWDKEKDEADILGWNDLPDKLAAITKARLAAAHPAAAYARYNDSDDTFSCEEDSSAPNSSISRPTIVDEEGGAYDEEFRQTSETEPRQLNSEEKGRREKFQAEVCKNDRWRSTTINAVIRVIFACLADKKPTSEGNVLAFCHSVPALDCCAAGLEQLQGGDFEYRVFRMDGSMSLEAKDTARRLFNSRKTGNILLLTYAVGGQGLNLQSATKVIYVTPQWNPAQDKQALSRALRAGQDKTVTIYRLYSPNSVEQEVLRKHPLKEYYADFTLGSARVKWERDWERWQTWDKNTFLQALSEIVEPSDDDVNAPDPGEMAEILRDLRRRG